MFTKTPGIGLTISADFSADIGDKCPMERQVDTSDFAAFTFGDCTDSVELSFTAVALRTFLNLAAGALAEMDGLFAGEQATKVELRTVNPTQVQEADNATQGHAATDAAPGEGPGTKTRQLVTAGERGA